MPGNSNFLQRALLYIARLARVTAISVGRPDDGVANPIFGPGTALDRPWGDVQAEHLDTLDAWRKNPLAKRIIGLITAYVVGDGIKLSSTYGPLNRFLNDWLTHPQNHIDQRQPDWCDELARTGELFVTLHTNPADGMSYVRTVSATQIDRLEWDPEDYETELTYHQLSQDADVFLPDSGRTWYSPQHPASQDPATPVMLHFAINRPIGCTRGESDLATILPWLKRYNRWLEDRVRLNAAVRAFLWIVKVPRNLIATKQEQYRSPPEPGSVIISEAGSEEWTPVTPSLSAGDAERDGRAIRWMIVAGGPGISLTDLGEAETANLATASAMGEQRQRFMRRRQTYFAGILTAIACTAYNRAVTLQRGPRRPCTLRDIQISLPDISATDNATLATAASQIATAMATLKTSGASGLTFLRLTLRIVLRFAGEAITEDDMAQMLLDSSISARTPPAPPPPPAPQEEPPT